MVKLVNDNLPKMANDLIKSKDGYIEPIPIDVFTKIFADISVPGPAQCLPDYLQLGVKGMFFYSETTGDKDPTLEKQEKVVLPYHDSSEPQQFQAFLGAYAIEGFFRGLLESNPGLGFYVDNSVTGGSFDTLTLNYILPGLYKHYGSINKLMKLNVEFLTVDRLTIYEDQEVVKAFANVRAELFVVGQNLDKTDALVLRAELRDCRANLTLNISEEINIVNPRSLLFF